MSESSNVILGLVILIAGTSFVMAFVVFHFTLVMWRSRELACPWERAIWDGHRALVFMLGWTGATTLVSAMLPEYLSRMPMLYWFGFTIAVGIYMTGRYEESCGRHPLQMREGPEKCPAMEERNA